MFLEFTLPIPANTLATVPASLVVPVDPGRITKVGIQFAAGCKGLVHAWVNHHGVRIFPSHPDLDIVADGWVVEWEEDYLLTERPLELVLAGYNLDDSYTHTLRFRFALLPLPGVVTGAPGPGLLRRIRSALIPPEGKQ